MDIKFAVSIANNSKYTKHTRNIARRIIFLKNGKKWKIHKIEWCEVGLQLADFATKDVGENDLNPRTKYVMVRIDNWYRTIVQEGWQDTW